MRMGGSVVRLGRMAGRVLSVAVLVLPCGSIGAGGRLPHASNASADRNAAAGERRGACH